MIPRSHEFNDHEIYYTKPYSFRDVALPSAWYSEGLVYIIPYSVERINLELNIERDTLTFSYLST